MHRRIRTDERAQHVLRTAPDDVVARAGKLLPDREHGVEVTLQRQYDEQKPRHHNMMAHIDVHRNDVV
ncbi:hypothetical protein GCM10018963_55890 [Saccharothrix longispora]